MRALELKIPPPVVALVAGLLMALVAFLFEEAALPIPYRVAVAFAIAGLGAVLDAWGMVSFLRARTTINPMKAHKASSLVTGGVFRITRNPMYLGLLLWLLAWAVYLANAASLAVLPLFVLYLNEFQIKPEERAMEALFGAEYARYRSRVRRWL